MTTLTALQILSIVLTIAIKAVKVLTTGKPTSIDEELKRLEAARLRPSADIIKEADEASAPKGEPTPKAS